MAQILLGVLTEHLAFMATDGALNDNLGSGGGYGTNIRWGHTLTLLAYSLHRKLNRHVSPVFTKRKSCSHLRKRTVVFIVIQQCCFSLTAPLRKSAPLGRQHCRDSG